MVQSLRINVYTRAFFDSPAVLRAVDAGVRKPLSKAGAFVRRRASSSIRRRDKVSEPGKPPSAHGDKLKKNILFAYDAPNQSVIVGPTKLNAVTAEDQPHTLEVGGTITIREKQLRPGGTWGPLFNRRSLRPGEAIRRRQIRVAARPYMSPALQAELPKFPELFANSIN